MGQFVGFLFVLKVVLKIVILMF